MSHTNIHTLKELCEFAYDLTMELQKWVPKYFFETIYSFRRLNYVHRKNQPLNAIDKSTKKKNCGKPKWNPIRELTSTLS